VLLKWAEGASFLGLAAALIAILGPFTGALALHDMLNQVFNIYIRQHHVQRLVDVIAQQISVVPVVETVTSLSGVQDKFIRAMGSGALTIVTNIPDKKIDFKYIWKTSDVVTIALKGTLSHFQVTAEASSG
jgi:hypothetical protein